MLVRQLIERIAALQQECERLREEQDKGYTLAHDCGFNAATLLAEDNYKKLQAENARLREQLAAATAPVTDEERYRIEKHSGTVGAVREVDALLASRRTPETDPK